MADMLQGGALLGDVLALIGAIMAAAYLLIGRRLREGMSLVPYIFLVYGIASIVLVLFVLGAGQPFTGYQPQTYLWFILLAFVPQLLGHSTFNWSLRYLSAALVSTSLLGEPVGSTILAYFILQETPGILKIFGAILILAGIFIATRSEIVQD
jgi:drug/metabolite transporter (DMT)-like permease